MPAIVNIEGIGERNAEILAKAKIGSTQTLLDRAATRGGRQSLAKETGLNPSQILNWVNRADLFRVRGVGEEFSDLLEAAGVDTVPELAKRNPEHLCQQMAEVNEKRHLVRRLPTLAEVSQWVERAKQLPRIVEY